MLPIELRHFLHPLLSRPACRPPTRLTFPGRELATAAFSGRPLVVLGLESSAGTQSHLHRFTGSDAPSTDDTCAAVVNSARQILSNVVMKQSTVHEKFGGIHPLHAQEAHQVNMPFAIQRALREANVRLEDLDGIAFTRGPGMYGCLSVCAGAAKALAAATGKPLIGVHHMVRPPSPLSFDFFSLFLRSQQAHALTPFLTASPNSPYPTPTFPFLTLLLSGGHTLLLHASSPSSFRILATTHDESIGACLDKASRDLVVDWALGNGSPGAALEKFAFPSLSLEGEEAPISAEGKASFPVPFKNEMAFSYAGLRSSLTRILAKSPVETLSEERKKSIARAFMLAAFEQIERKVALALQGSEQHGEEKVKGLVVSGGVASNLILRERCVAVSPFFSSPFFSTTRED